MKTIDTIDTSPFKKLVMTIGELPTTFIESMSYYEALAWLVDYIQKTVIPAVNNNAEAVEELQKLFIELKSFVDNYFENLDVQDEIDNKLDEMAASGQLAEIIAQFLGLKSVYAFDTIADMSVSEYLNEGSVCKTLGKTDAMTGDGSFYRVRERLNSDNPDGVNLVVLTNTDNLVAEIVPNYFINGLQTQIGDTANLTTNDKSNVVNAINELNAQIFTPSTLVNDIKEFPLLVTKRSDGTLDGAMQGLTAEFNSNGTPSKIYQWIDYSTYAKLYVTTCGSRTDGTGWSTVALSSGTDQIPYAHGSAIGIKDGFVLVGELTGKTFAKINPSAGTYETIDLSSYLPDGDYYLVSVIWDEETSTYNILKSDNVTHFILDEQFNLIRTYTYEANAFDFSTSYALQGYDYYNGFEYRVMSTTTGRNICLVIDTINGKILKTFTLSTIVGEIESIVVNRNIALFSYNNADAYCDLINHHYVTEAYIGGYPEANIKFLQDYAPVLHYTNMKQGILGEGGSDASVNIYFQDTYATGDVVRYIGDGSSANPIKSGSALGTIFSLLNNLNTNVYIKVYFNASTNTDDNGIRLTTKLGNVREIDLDCNSNSGNITHCFITNNDSVLRLRKINITSPHSGRRDNKLTLAGNHGGLNFYNASTVPAFDINLNSFVRLASGSMSATGTSVFSYNVCVESTAGITSYFTSTGTITRNSNNTTD